MRIGKEKNKKKIGKEEIEKNKRALDLKDNLEKKLKEKESCKNKKD